MTSKLPPRQLPKAYNPLDVEERLYAWWESSGFFAPRADAGARPFTIIMPPPNVTGDLHVGQALTATVEDALIRYHRMLGDATLWLPGVDHAGIATQMVVERELAKEGLSRHDLGREEFLKRVWEWVEKYGDAIDNQHRRLGASCDWTRRRFTLDPGPSKAVRTTFVNLYRKGLIYRGERMINWCPSCRTALSDLEVEHQEQQGILYYIRYRLEQGDGYVTVATTRPETLLGDTAVAVHPGDERYHGIKGQRVLLPVLGRAIPLIEDEAVDPAFGTGALKITPGHDPNDFETGQRHSLPIINILNPDGSLNEEAGPYAGYDRFDARTAIVAQLEQEGLLERVEPHQHAVGHCQRSGDIVEPIVSEQWFVQVGPLAQRAMEAVTGGRIRIVPDRFTRAYLNWMENIRDWCISRQLWWGHRIPVWYCESGHQTVAVDDPDACEVCGSSALRQDEDVLDTWFSSGLWPHSTLGWPNDTDDLRRFYPTDVMETGYDILFFWVARMVMMGLENIGDIPFHTVYLHGLIRDEQGRKMSKTTGNVIDPVETIQQYGTDALRFALSTGTSPGNDSRLSTGKLQAARNFANKLWNAARYVLSTLEGASGLEGWYDAPPRVHRQDRWILGRLDQVTEEVRRLWEEFLLGEAQQVVHDFIWGELCDWYIELAKVRFRTAGDEQPRQVLAHVMERTLRLLHPFMPFVTEELWQQLTATLPREADLPESIMLAPYPAPSGVLADEAALREMGLVTGVVRAIRNVRAEFRVEPQKALDAVLVAPEDQVALKEEVEVLRQLARLEKVKFVAARTDAPPASQAVTLVVQQATVVLPLGGVVDLAGERRRLEAELAESEPHAQRLAARLADGQFTQRAPEEVVERERGRLEEARQRQQRLEELLRDLGT